MSTGCQYVMRFGPNSGEYCGKPVVEGQSFCKTCYRPSGYSFTKEKKYVIVDKAFLEELARFSENDDLKEKVRDILNNN